MLHENGTRILKFYLHISPEEQLERFKQRLDDAPRHWKISETDYSERELWSDYIEAFEDAMERTSTKHAPWYVIPSNHKWFRNLAISEIVAGTLVVTGLYTLLLPLVAFAALGSSRDLVVAADSATAAILAGTLSLMAPVASAHYVALAGMVALLTAGYLLLARLFKLGFLADFLSQTVLVGFLTGVGFQVGIAMLGEMLGVPVNSNRTIEQLAQVVHGLPQLHVLTLCLAGAVVAIVLVLRRIAPQLPGPLFAVVGAIAASAAFDFSGHGISVIQAVTGGLPLIGLPDVSWAEIPPLLPVAGSCFLMIVAQSAATARAYASHHRQALDENTDLVGLAAANAAAALSGTFVVNGSPTQTAMLEGAGGQSQIAQIATAAVVAL